MSDTGLVHHAARALAPILLALGTAAACDDDPAPTTYDATVPAPEFDHVDSAAIEAARSDSAWRDFAEQDRQLRAWHRPIGDSPPPAPPTTDHRDHRPGDRRTADSTGHSGTGQPAHPAHPAGLRQRADSATGPTDDRSSALDVQVLLDHAGFSPGAIDGHWGQNTAKAIFWFQHERELEPTGRIDERTLRRLLDDDAPPTTLARYRVRAQDLDGPFAPVPAGIYEKARQRCLCYATPLELVAERFHTTPGLIRRLNPDTDLDRLEEGTTIRVPNVQRDRDPPRIDRIIISRRGSYTHAVDGDGRILWHFPSTLGSRYSPTPAGGYRVRAIVPWPRFHYTPDLFHDVPDERPEAVLPPGPNSPIGAFWIELSRPYYGIHGTAAPETIGYVSSHGCVRLTNWDVYTLARGIRAGTPVEFR